MYPYCHEAEMTRLTSCCVSLQSQECAQVFLLSGVHMITVWVPFCILLSVCMFIGNTRKSPAPKGLWWVTLSSSSLFVSSLVLSLQDALPSSPCLPGSLAQDSVWMSLEDVAISSWQISQDQCTQGQVQDGDRTSRVGHLRASRPGLLREGAAAWLEPPSAPSAVCIFEAPVETHRGQGLFSHPARGNLIPSTNA